MFVPCFTKRSTEQIFAQKSGGGGISTGGKIRIKGSDSASERANAKDRPKGKSSPLSSTSQKGGKDGGKGGKPLTVPPGHPFAGRPMGGGTRDQVFGSKTYGSGYPGASRRGVTHRGFPFHFWPVVWGGAAGGAGSGYLHNTEYGSPDNSSRPGGAMSQANFVSNSTGIAFHLLADKSTVASLISSIDTNCSHFLVEASSMSPTVFNISDPNAPKPEQAVEYYRASSVVLTLDGYNNTATLSNDTNALDTPLPTGIDTTLLNCLNQTIGFSVPISNAGLWSAGPGMEVFYKEGQ